MKRENQLTFEVDHQPPCGPFNLCAETRIALYRSLLKRIVLPYARLYSCTASPDGCAHLGPVSDSPFWNYFANVILWTNSKGELADNERENRRLLLQHIMYLPAIQTLELLAFLAGCPFEKIGKTSCFDEEINFILSQSKVPCSLHKVAYRHYELRSRD